MSAAIRYYETYGCDSVDVLNKLTAEEIHIGAPKDVDGTLRVNEEGRYIIVSEK